MKTKTKKKENRGRTGASEWCTLATYPYEKTSTIRAFTDAWAAAVDLVDQKTRLDSARRWHAEHRAFTADAFASFIEEIDRLTAALLAEDSDARPSLQRTFGPSFCEVLREPLVLPYAGYAMPDHLACEDELEGLDEEERECRVAEGEMAQEGVVVPKLAMEEVLRLAKAKSVKEVLDDPSFLALNDAIVGGEGASPLNPFRRRFRMRLAESALRTKLCLKLNELFELCAVRAKSLGEMALARTFVEAVRATRVIGEHDEDYTDFLDVLDEDTPVMSEDLALVTEGVWPAFVELQRAVAVKALPTWAKARGLARKAEG